ncbi:hypothetical protein ACFL6D_05345, partial [Spirochaetota bacterium]
MKNIKTFIILILAALNLIFSKGVMISWEGFEVDAENNWYTERYQIHYGRYSRGSAVYPSEFTYENKIGGIIYLFKTGAVNGLLEDITYYFAVTAEIMPNHLSKYSKEIVYNTTEHINGVGAPASISGVGIYPCIINYDILTEKDLIVQIEDYYNTVYAQKRITLNPGMDVTVNFDLQITSYIPHGDKYKAVFYLVPVTGNIINKIGDQETLLSVGSEYKHADRIIFLRRPDPIYNQEPINLKLICQVSEPKEIRIGFHDKYWGSYGIRVVQINNVGYNVINTTLNVVNQPYAGVDYFFYIHLWDYVDGVQITVETLRSSGITVI